MWNGKSQKFDYKIFDDRIKRILKFLLLSRKGKEYENKYNNLIFEQEYKDGKICNGIEYKYKYDDNNNKIIIYENEYKDRKKKKNNYILIQI